MNASPQPPALGNVTVSTDTRPSLEELRLAYRAAARGDFRDRGPATSTMPDPVVPQPVRVAGSWHPTEPVVAVLGCHGGAGASTAAAAMATAHCGKARVVECGAATTSAYCAASTAELGQTETGWVIGERGSVRLERGSGLPLRPEDLNPPDPVQPGTTLTVLDVTWEPRALYCSSAWLSQAVFAAVTPVLVTTATAPGMRHLEAVLHLLEDHVDPVVVVRGGQRRGRWPAPVERQTGHRTRQLRQAGRVLPFPTDDHLAVNGLDANPLPASVITAGAHVLRLARPTAGEVHHTKEMNR